MIVDTGCLTKSVSPGVSYRERHSKKLGALLDVTMAQLLFLFVLV